MYIKKTRARQRRLVLVCPSLSKSTRMLLPIFILCFSHLVLASPLQPEYDVEDIQQLEYHFNDFKVKYNRSFTTAEEESLRLHYFKENLVKINELNRKYNPMTVYGINEFTDWSDEEIQTLLGFRGPTLDRDFGICAHGVIADIKTERVPDRIDWREQNAVAAVQNQMACGSCWAFSSAAVVEGAYAVKHSVLPKLSEQQFLDCDNTSAGCGGGWMHDALTSSIRLGGLELESDYPYADQQGKCRFDARKTLAEVLSCTVYPNIGDADNRLAMVLVSGPLSIALDAAALIQYKEGILLDCDATDMNHAVTLVGYGEEHDIPYWIIKNSWGTSWGENGYVRVQKGVGCLMIGQYVLSVEVA